MLVSEINRSLVELQQKAQEFSKYLNSLQMNFENKEMEIKNLENRRLKIKDEVEAAQKKAGEVLAKASDEASVVRKEANELMKNANELMEKSRAEKIEAQQIRQQAEAAMQAVTVRERSVSSAEYQFQEKTAKLKAAMGV